MNGTLQALATLAAMAGTIGAYDHWVVRPQRIAVVDVAAVYRQNEAEFTRLLTRSTRDTDREQALQLARRFAQRLPAALEELPQDCHCLVLLSSAVAASGAHVTDLTAALARKLEPQP
jgi:hypothetical protein